MRLLVAVLSFLLLAACGAESSAPRDRALDRLFAELQAAPSPDEARAVEERIWARWRDSGSATVDVLLDRATQAESAGDAGLAVEFLSEASDLAPHFAEPWNRRAVLAYDQQDFAGAISAINETLKREPRHFGALTGLGLIYEDLGRTRSALRAYRAALEVHPHFEEARRGVRRLEPLIDGAEA